MLFIAIAIKLNSKGPVIFKQERVGRKGKVFKIYKFRSMYIDAEERKEQLMDQNEMSGYMFKISFFVFSHKKTGKKLCLQKITNST